MSFRSAQASDLAAIMAIESSAHFHPWPPSVVTRYLAKTNTTWVLEEQGKVVAYAVNTLIVGEAELLMIAVLPSQQGRGYGRKLMNALQAWLEQQQAQRWFLDVRESNSKAIALYESLGFCQVGVRPNYYPTAKGSEDALLYAVEF